MKSTKLVKKRNKNGLYRYEGVSNLGVEVGLLKTADTDTLYRGLQTIFKATKKDELPKISLPNLESINDQLFP